MAQSIEFHVSTNDGSQFIFPIAPEKVSITLEGRTIPYTALRTGTYPIPAGRQPEMIEFTAIFPGRGRTDLYNVAQKGAFPEAVTGWVDPQNYIHVFETALNADQMQVYLLCADLGVAAWYRVESTRQDFDETFAFGDVSYTLRFSERRVPTVSATTATGNPISASPSDFAPTSAGLVPGQDIIQPPAPNSDGLPHSGQTYTMQSGDTLSGISVRAYGDDSHASAIASANGITDPSTILPGQALSLP